MSDLHARLVAEIERLRAHLVTCASCTTCEATAGYRALRAVVELHAPIPCGWPTCKTPDTHRLCAACGSAVNHPCTELELIADQLGLTQDQEPSPGRN